MTLMIIMHNQTMEVQDSFSELGSKSAKEGNGYKKRNNRNQHQLRTAQVAELERIWAEHKCMFP